MTNFGKILALIVCIILISICPSFSQTEQYNFLNISNHPEITRGGIKYIMKDSKGFMWFGSSDGLYRYDGYQIIDYKNFLNDSLAIVDSRYCTEIFEDNNGNFWIGTLKNGLARYDRVTETFTRYIHFLDGKGLNEIMEIYQDRNSDIWFGTIHRGIFKLDNKTGSFEHFLIDTINKSREINHVLFVFEDKSGVFWLGTGEGLLQFDREKKIFTPVVTEPVAPESVNVFSSVIEDANGLLWFGSCWGIFIYDLNKQWKHIITENPERPDYYEDIRINLIREYSNNENHQMWISTQGGLKVYDCNTGKLTHLNDFKDFSIGLKPGLVQYIYLDNHNLLWAGLNGLTIFDLKKNPFEQIKMKSCPDLKDDVAATYLFEDNDGYIWVGTYNEGIYQFDSELNYIANYKPTLWDTDNPALVYKNHVNFIFEDSGRNLWIGMNYEGISIFDRILKKFNTLKLDEFTGNHQNLLLTDMLEDENGRLWIATNSGLFISSALNSKYKDFLVIKHPVLSHTPISDILIDSKENIWVVTVLEGIFKINTINLDSLNFKRYFHKNYHYDSFIKNNVSSIFEDINGVIWLHANTGLFKYNSDLDSILPHSIFKKVFSEITYEFTGDNAGNLWFIADHGLVKFNPYDTLKNSVKIFDKNEGLPFTTINHYAFFTDSKGYIYKGSYRGTGEGFFRFHPNNINEDNEHIPEIVITDFKVHNEAFALDSSITYTKHITLLHNQNFFSLEFAALDYKDPLKNKYAYLLEGLDNDWNNSGSRRFANYTGVPPGNYVFRVKGSNNDGYWNEEGASVAITILPPPWETWWAYSIYGIFIIGLIYTWRKYDLKRQKLKQDLELEHVEAEKLKELDKMKSRFFANISHEFRTPLTLILGPLEKLRSKIKDRESEEDLNMMQRNARRLQNLINQLLSLSKLESGQMNLQASEENIISMVKGYLQSFESLAKQKNIELLFTSTIDNINVFLDRDKLEKILYNLLSNAFKFTGEEGRIEVLVTPLSPSRGDSGWIFPLEGDRGVTLKISDTGRGIPPEQLNQIFDRFYQADNSYTQDQEGSGIGLALTKELVELHHGIITVESIVGKGTTFTVSLPLGKEHLKPEEIVDDGEIVEPVKLGENDNLFAKQITQDALNDDEFEKDDAKPLLLIVEDNGDLRSYIRSYLTNGYRISEAINGEMGLEKAIEKIPDLIISDVMMPKMDGIELCRRLKTDERTSHIPVILLTAKATMEDRLEGLETGADDFLTKPFDQQELQVRIKNLIRQRIRLQKIFTRNIGSIGQLTNNDIASMDKKFIQKLVEVIEENLSDANFGVEQLGQEMAMSRMQVHRKLKALLNQTPGEFIRSIRLNRAAELLKNKTGNIAEIAYDVGFNNPSWFSECFKKQFGKLPSEYNDSSDDFKSSDE